MEAWNIVILKLVYSICKPVVTAVAMSYDRLSCGPMTSIEAQHNEAQPKDLVERPSQDPRLISQTEILGQDSRP